MLYLYLPEIRDRVAAINTDEEEEKHHRLLIDKLEAEYKHIETLLRSMMEARKITFELAWALFKPGVLVVGRSAGFDDLQCYQVECITPNRDEDREIESYTVEARYIDHNGAVLGYKTEEINIARFQGTRDITELRVYPTQVGGKSLVETEQLIARGKKFFQLESLKSYPFRSYEGSALADGVRKEIDATGRIIIDNEAYRAHKEASEDDVKEEKNAGMEKKEKRLVASPRCLRW